MRWQNIFLSSIPRDILDLRFTNFHIWDETTTALLLIILFEYKLLLYLLFYFIEVYLWIYLFTGNFVWGGMSSSSNGMNSLEQETETQQPPPVQLGPSHIPQNRFEPYFDAMTPRNVTALVGKSAYLSCRVRNLGNKTVRINNLLYLFTYKKDIINCATFSKYFP